MTIIESLLVEHELLRKMMGAMSQWLTESLSPEKLRERAAMLEVAIDDHAAREEQQLFEPLRASSNSARDLIGLMELVHEEVRDLFREVADPRRDPQERLWTILMLTEEHFAKEEVAVFPLAERILGSERLEIQAT